MDERTRRDAAAMRVLRAASAFGAVFWRGGVRAVAGDLDDDALDTALSTLVKAGIITPAPTSRIAGETAYAFADPSRAEALDGCVPETERAVAHGRAARWLQSAGELDVTVIASQLLRSDTPREAASWCAEAARNAVHDRAYDDALVWSERAIELGVDAVSEASLRMLQTGVYDARGAIELAERAAFAAWKVAPHGSHEWFRAAASIAVLSMRLLRPEPFRELGPAIEEALRNPASGVAPAGLAYAVFPMLQSAQYALADLVLERLEEILASGEQREPTFPARVYAARALRALFNDDPSGYLTESTRAARAYESLAEPRLALLHWNNVGFAQISLGDGAGAVETLNGLIRDAATLDLQRVVASARHNLGLALVLTGATADAIALERHVITAAESLGDAHLAASAQIYLARALLAGGDMTGALEAADVGLAALSKQPGARVFGLAIRAHALLGLGRVDEALHDANESMRVLATVGFVEEGEALARLAHVEALRAHGDVVAAMTALGVAHARLMARAGRIPEPRRREGFLSGVPEHARTVALVTAARPRR